MNNVCSRLNGEGKKTCRDIVLNNGKRLIEDIQSGKVWRDDHHVIL